VLASHLQSQSLEAQFSSPNFMSVIHWSMILTLLDLVEMGRYQIYFCAAQTALGLVVAAWAATREDAARMRGSFVRCILYMRECS